MEKRRQFIKRMSGITAGIILPVQQITLTKGALSDKWGQLLPTRKLGITNKEVTMLGVGGYHISWPPEKTAQAIIETAIEGGVRFFDTAESYGPHTSEIRYGKYLTPKYRNEIFLMTKSTARDAKKMRKHLEGSLKRMNTDYLDLWQVHSVRDKNDVDSRMANGVFDVVMKAKEEGKVKHVGFTGHRDPKANLRVMEITSDKPIFETIQMPINVMDAHLDHFINTVLPVAMKSNLGILAMKTLSDGRFFSNKIQKDNVVWETENPAIPNRISIKEALYFVWSLPVSVIITGAESVAFMQEKIDFAREFSSFTKSQREKLITKVSDLANEGRVEYYKKIS